MGHNDENGGNISEMRGTHESVRRYGGQRWGIGGHLLPLKA